MCSRKLESVLDVWHASEGVADEDGLDMMWSALRRVVAVDQVIVRSGSPGEETGTLVVCRDDDGRAVRLVARQDGVRTVWIVLSRNHGRYSQTELAILAMLRPHLAAALIRVRYGHRMRPLSPRERQVLALVSYGLTSAAIARELTTSQRTVHKHLEHIYAKLGVHDRTSAALRFSSLDAPDRQAVGAGYSNPSLATRILAQGS